jgi:hypothetical protein
LELPRDWSAFPDEEEVLLMPFFCFQVVSIKKITEETLCPITLITLMEIPYQNFLNMRKITLTSLIWADANIDSDENQSYKKKFIKAGPTFSEANTVSRTIELLNSTVQSVLLISGSMGNYLVPIIHNLRQVGKIIVFCMSVEYHSTWASKYSKITLISADFN